MNPTWAAMENIRDNGNANFANPGYKTGLRGPIVDRQKEQNQ